MTADFNNFNLGKLAPTQVTPTEKETPVHAAHVEPDAIDEKVLDKVPVGQAAIVGQSQVINDNIAADIATFLNNPHRVELANAVYDKAYETFVNKNIEHPAEKAALVASQYIAEVSDKPNAALK